MLRVRVGVRVSVKVTVSVRMRLSVKVRVIVRVILSVKWRTIRILTSCPQKSPKGAIPAEVYRKGGATMMQELTDVFQSHNSSKMPA